MPLGDEVQQRSARTHDERVGEGGAVRSDEDVGARKELEALPAQQKRAGKGVRIRCVDPLSRSLAHLQQGRRRARIRPVVGVEGRADACGPEQLCDRGCVGEAPLPRVGARHDRSHGLRGGVARGLGGTSVHASCCRAAGAGGAAARGREVGCCCCGCCRAEVSDVGRRPGLW